MPAQWEPLTERLSWVIPRITKKGNIREHVEIKYSLVAMIPEEEVQWDGEKVPKEATLPEDKSSEKERRSHSMSHSTLSHRRKARCVAREFGDATHWICVNNELFKLKKTRPQSTWIAMLIISFQRGWIHRREYYFWCNPDSADALLSVVNESRSGRISSPADVYNIISITVQTMETRAGKWIGRSRYTIFECHDNNLLGVECLSLQPHRQGV